MPRSPDRALRAATLGVLLANGAVSVGFVALRLGVGRGVAWRVVMSLLEDGLAEPAPSEAPGVAEWRATAAGRAAAGAHSKGSEQAT